MALNKKSLKSTFRKILKNPNINGNSDAVADALADAIDTYVKTGKAVGADSRGDTHNLPIT